ncbi:MAG: MCE family protein [Spirochaetes bacterium]|nr:MCE family protein [Spirochaetota bacterium]
MYNIIIDKITARKAGIISFVILMIMVILLLYGIFERDVERYYPLRVNFRFIGDLKEGAPVKYLGGMSVGFVKDLYAAGYYVETLLYIKKNFRIKEGSEFSIYTVGFVGSRYIEIDPPRTQGPDNYIQPGSLLQGNDAMGIEIIQQNLARLSQEFVYSKVQGPPPPLPVILDRASRLLYTFKQNIRRMRPSFRESVAISSENILKALHRLKQADARLKTYHKELKGLDKEELAKYFTFVIQTENIMKELSQSVEGIADISEKLITQTDEIRKRKNTIGKLVYTDEHYDRIEKMSESFLKLSEDLLERSLFTK